MLLVDIEKQLGEFRLAVSFTSNGLVTGLFGNSGAGKTSIINMIAGLIRPDRGHISLDEETLDDTASGLHVPPHRRRIGYVFQDARLFPHLSVRQNLDYGRRMNGFDPDAVAETRTVDLLDIGHLLDRRPAQLSGGERQRVALGRALLAKPKLLLLDEPLGALDDERKAEILPYFVRLRDEASVPMVLLSFGISLRGQRALQRGSDRAPVLAATAIKLLLMPLLAWLLCLALGLGPHETFVATTIAALPTAQNVYNYAATYRRAETQVRDTVFVTTFAALPVIAFIAWMLAA